MQLALAIITYLAIGTIMTQVFLNDKVDTITISNVGFAVLLTLSNSCFAWARTLDDKKYKQLGSRINDKAITGMIAAICFILASILKYLATHIENGTIKPLDNLSIPFLFYKFASLALFEIAFIQTVIFLSYIIIYINIYKHRRNSLDPYL